MGVHLGGQHGLVHNLGHGIHHGFHHSPFYLGFHYQPWYAGYGNSWNGGGYYPNYLPYTSYYDGSIYSQNLNVAQQLPPSASQDPVIAAPPPLTTTEAGLEYQRRAEEAFRSGDYGTAVQLANHALVEMPQDGKLYLFAAQALFALADYQGGAAAIHQGVSLLPPEEWGYVVENYRRYYRDDAFVQQMKSLDQYIAANSTAAYAYFLRGYQFGFLGHKPAAIRDLNKALALESRDQLAARLVEHFGGTAPATNVPPNPNADPKKESAPEQLNQKTGNDSSLNFVSSGNLNEPSDGPLVPSSNAGVQPTPLIDDLNSPLVVSGH